MVEVLRKELSMSYEDALEHVKATVSEQFTVLFVQAIDEVIRKKLNLSDYPLKYTTILACRANLAKMALDVSLDVGTIMPCSFTVYEEDSKVYVAHVSIMKMAKELGLADGQLMKPVIEETGKHVNAVWDKF